MAQAVAPNAAGISQGVVNWELTAMLLATRTRSVAVRSQINRDDSTRSAAVCRPRLVPRQPGPREFLSKSSRRPRRKDANTEVQQPADNEYLERERYQPKSQANNSAEQVEHHAYGKEAQHGE